jgi:membrane-associated phospholipid phosphatase
MLAHCRRCALACSVVASLSIASAEAQTAGSSGTAAPSLSSGQFPQSSLSRQRSIFSGLFAATLNDFKSLPSRENLVIAGIGGLAAGLVRAADGHATQTLAGSERLGTVLTHGELLGGAKMQMATAIATQVVGHAIRNPRVSAIGADLVRAQLVTQMVTAGIKLSVRRTRPDGTQFSFPSGHSSTTFATATVLQRHLGWRAGVPAYAFASYVAASRVQDKRHYLSDVTLGAALGIIAGRSVTVGRGEARFALGPSVVPGGAGVNFTLVGRK